jgi:hypothetical protein
MNISLELNQKSVLNYQNRDLAVISPRLTVEDFTGTYSKILIFHPKNILRFSYISTLPWAESGKYLINGSL